MPVTQPAVVETVIAFAPHAARALSAARPGRCLSPQDRMQVAFWQDRARLAGYDRMVIHDRDAGDACEVGNFLSVYLRGQAWSRWGFARAGARVRAWCCLTGADVGDFASLNEALQAVLRGAGDACPDAFTGVVGGNVVQMRFGGRAGA